MNVIEEINPNQSDAHWQINLRSLTSHAVIPVLVTGIHTRELSTISEGHGEVRGEEWIPMTSTGITDRGYN